MPHHGRIHEDPDDHDGATELTEIEVAELSRVVEAATGREALTLKTGGKGSFAAVLAVPAEGEAAMDRRLREKGVGRDARVAAVAARRLVHGWLDQMPHEARRELASRLTDDVGPAGDVFEAAAEGAEVRRELARLRRRRR